MRYGRRIKYRRKLKYYLIKIFRLHDCPQSVAGGLAWGTFVHFYPTLGLGPFLAVGLASISNANLVAATLGWAVTLPVFPFFFYLNYLVGNQLTPFACGGDFSPAASSLFGVDLGELLMIGQAFLVGSIINGFIAVVLLWRLGYLLLTRYRQETLDFIKRTL